MEKPDFITDGQERTWSNSFSVLFPVFLFFAFGGLFMGMFIQHTGWYGYLVTGIVVWYFTFEITVNAYIRVYYLDGELVFLRPLRKFSFFFRKRTQLIRIRPDEWTEVYRHSFKGGTAYYFRNGRTAAYFIKADGLSNFYQYLDTLFPKRVKETDEFPMDIRRRLKREMPERVF
jgi:hypothetical protein